MKTIKYLLIATVSLALLAACAPAVSASSSTVDASSMEEEPSISIATDTPESDPYSIEALADRTYGEGEELTVEYLWERQEDFARYYITYTSDGLTIHGFVDVPNGEGPFPVVIALHGYIPASEYKTLDYSTRYADSISRKGYIVLHPNMRNFPPSDSQGRIGDSYAGYTVDVLNLLALVQKSAGQEGIFENADMEHLGIWGHSLGGGVALRVATLVDNIDAIVLYAAVSQRYNFSSTGLPIYDLSAINAPFSIHHGTEDDTIPPAWSETLCEKLEELGKEYDCYFYDGQPHTFLRSGSDDALFIQRTIEFYDTYLQN